MSAERKDAPTNTFSRREFLKRSVIAGSGIVFIDGLIEVGDVSREKRAIDNTADGAIYWSKYTPGADADQAEKYRQDEYDKRDIKSRSLSSSVKVITSGAIFIAAIRSTRPQETKSQKQLPTLKKLVTN